MNKPSYNELFETLNKVRTTKYISTEQAKVRYQLCYNSLAKIAKEAGAFIKIGRSARIDTEKLDAYLAENCAVK